MDSFRRLEQRSIIDVVIIQETKADELWMARLRDTYDRSWGYGELRLERPISHWSPSAGLSGGLGLLVHPHSELRDVCPLWPEMWSPYFLAVTARWGDEFLAVLAVYAPSDYRRREQLFTLLAQRDPPTATLFVGGDFNCVLDPELDRRAPTRRHVGSSALLALLDRWRLVDVVTPEALAVTTPGDLLDFHARHHTFHAVTKDRSVYSSRLDRWYVSMDQLSRMAGPLVQVPSGVSDHDGVLVHFRRPDGSGARPRTRRRPALRFPLPGYAREAIDTHVENAIRDFRSSVTSMAPADSAQAWDSFKDSLRRDCLRLRSSERRNLRAGYRSRIREAVTTLQTAKRFSTGRSLSAPRTADDLVPPMEGLTLDPGERHRRLRRQVQDLLRGRLAARKRRKFALYAGHGGKAERAFFRRISTKYGTRAVTSLTAEDMATAWRPILSATEPDDAAVDAFFSGLPPVQHCHPEVWLTSPFSVHEVLQAIKSCACGRSGGPDGLPNDFYRRFAEPIADLLAPLFSAWYQAATLPRSFGEAVVHCVPKVSTPRTGLDFRPLSLTNSDYKVFARVVATRVRSRLSALVCPTQFGFVPHRDVHDAVDLFHALQHQVAAGVLPVTSAAVLLDFSKAYDTLSRRFLLRALERYGFPMVSCEVVRQMHAGTSVHFYWNGRLSQRVPVHTGIRQGCPLAPLLFILAINTLLESFRHDQRLPGVSLDGHAVTGVGYADDTTVFLSHPSEEPALLDLLDGFGAASGLRVNVSKSAVIALSPDGPSSVHRGMVFPVRPRDSLTRYLGVQVGSRPNAGAIWSLTEQQIASRLFLAQVKTTDTLQRVRICRAVVVPKLLFVSRHHWPSRSAVDRLQRAMRNYIWHGRFTAERVSGKAWMSAHVAALPRRDGGLDVPDLRQLLSRLSSRTVAGWIRHPSQLCRAVGAVLRSNEAGPLSPSRRSPTAAHSRTLAAAGRIALEAVATQVRSGVETGLLQPLLLPAARGRLSVKDWCSGWLQCDFSRYSEQLTALRRHQTAVHGRFYAANLLRARLDRDLLLLPERLSLWSTALSGLTAPASTVRDILELRWVRPQVLSFRCITAAFPLPPRLALRFRALCDLLVANYPGLLLPMDSADVLPVSPSSSSVWKVSPGGTGYLLVRDDVAGQRACGYFHDRRTLLPLIKRASGPDASSPMVGPHESFMLCPPIWDPRQRDNCACRVETPARTSGLAEVAARDRRWSEQDPILATAVLQISWLAIFRLAPATSAQRLLLHRIRGLRLPGWAANLQRRGCPHCPVVGTVGGDVPHIFWRCPAASRLCPAASRLWARVLALWQRFGLWRGAEPSSGAFATAVFSLRLPANPPTLMGLLPPAANTSVEHVFPLLMRLWQAQVLSTFQIIWRWRCGCAADEPWSPLAAERRVTAALQDSLRNAADDAEDDSLAAAILAAARYLTFDGPVFRCPRLPAPSPSATQFLLFFDGGSRGNPGPGGAGAIIVAVYGVGVDPAVVWAASPTTTNNVAEYSGLVVGLRAAVQYRLTPLHVIGDSRLILNQVERHRPPRNPRLLLLYRQARPLADILAVRSWTHHLRAFNKMADAAANVAMDRRRSMQTTHPDRRADWGPVLQHLHSDTTHWMHHQPL